jgi:hypothetical protein
MALISKLVNDCRRWLHVLVLGMLVLLPAPRASAAVDTFYNSEGLLDYLPPIQATNFVNDANFSFTIASGVDFSTSLYRNWQYVRNFTNSANGIMDCNTGFYFYNYDPYFGSGPAANFYNAGPINCGVGDSYFSYYPGFSYGGYGGIKVWATNIYNNGTITVGVSGFAQFSGNDLVFDGANVALQTVEELNGSSPYAQFSTPKVSATGQANKSTNDWDPGFALGSTYAFSGALRHAPFSLDLFNSTPYTSIRQRSPTNYVVRMIFIQDVSGNGVTTNVYFQGGFSGDGSAHVEWIGTYIDPATALPVNTYFYLDNNYDAGSSTNILKFGDVGYGVPFNYTLYSSTTQQGGYGAPETNLFFPGLVPFSVVKSNIYSYVNAEIIPTDISTNQMLNYQPGYLPGRVEITATNSLNLSEAAFTGMNYFLLNSPKEFNTDSKYPVAAPYSDVYVGHTNGSLVFSNVISSFIPSWSGNIQAWTTRWTYVDTNSIVNNPLLPPGNTNEITYDFRVLLVFSQLAPTSDTHEGTVAVYSSNNVVISDKLNINSNLFLNCTNLLLTTNDMLSGAASPDGELNLMPTTFLWANATTRLRCLTNNGAIRTMNPISAQVFGGTGSPYLALYNSGLIDNAAGMTINALNLEHYGTILAGTGSFIARTITTTMSNATVQAGTTFSNAANDMVITGTAIQAGRSLTLIATNSLTDNGVLSSNFWSLGSGYAGLGFTSGQGLVLPLLPATGDLLGTTISIQSVGTIRITNTWAGQNRGYSNTGYDNNAAIGQLILDAQTNTSKFVFVGTGTNNAMYVDCLYLNNYASYTNRVNTNLLALSFKNIVIYYAQAIDSDGTSVAEKINGFNTNCLRWVPTYAGYFSSTNIVYPDGTTNAVNAALAASPSIDSDRDGSPNSADPTPVLVTSQVSFDLTLTTNTPPQVRLLWKTIPLAANYIYYNTNLAATNWLPFTNFSTYYYGTGIGAGTAVAKTNAGNYFISPQPYINATPADNWQMTNVWIFDTPTNVPHYYRVLVQPN